MKPLESFEQYLTVGMKLAEAPPDIQREGARAMAQFEQLNPGARQRAQEQFRPEGIRGVEHARQFQLGDLADADAEAAAPQDAEGMPAEPPSPAALLGQKPSPPPAAPPPAEYIDPQQSQSVAARAGYDAPQQLVDPSFQAFLRAKGEEYRGKYGDALFNQLKASGTAAPEFQDWANSLWEEELAKAKGEHRSIQRVNPDLGESYRKNRTLGQAANETAGQLLDTATAFTNSAADSGALVVPGAGTAIAAKVGDKQDLEQYRQAQERHPTAAFLGGLAGSYSPQNIVGLVGRGLGAAGSKVASALFPKAPPVVRFLGRTASAVGTAGGLAAGEGALRDAESQGAYGETPEDGAAMRRFVQGAAGGGIMHVAGEGSSAIAGALENAHPEISAARKVGAGPSMFRGVAARENAPVHDLENLRQELQTDTLQGAAAQRSSKTMADQGSKLNQAELDQSARETSDAYNRLARGPKPHRLSDEAPLKISIDESALSPEELDLHREQQAANAGQRPFPQASDRSTFNQTLPPTPQELAGTKKFETAIRNKGESKAVFSEAVNAKAPYASDAPNLRSLRAKKLPAIEPVKVSTAPVVDRLMTMLEEEHINPETGQQIPILPSDNALRQEVQRFMKVEVLPRTEARKLPPGNSTSIMSTATAVREGLVDPRAATGKDVVVVVSPTELGAPDFDKMVNALQKRAKFDKELKEGDPRYRALAAAAMEARKGFGPDYEAMKATQEERFRTGRERAEGAGLQLGEDKHLPDYEHTAFAQKQALNNAVANYRNPQRGEGAKLRDQHMRAIVDAAGPEARAELEQVPAAAGVDELLEKVRFGPGVTGRASSGGQVGATVTQRALGAAGLRAYPALKALGGSRAPEQGSGLAALGAKLSPELKELLRSMRREDVGVSELAAKVGLRGGLPGVHLSSGLEQRRRAKGGAQFTSEDAQNLLRLKEMAKSAVDLGN